MYTKYPEDDEFILEKNGWIIPRSVEKCWKKGTVVHVKVVRMRRFGLQRPAEVMARAAGTAFRLFAGTDSLNVGLTASHTASLDPNDPQVHPKRQHNEHLIMPEHV